jgi:hypothetical protein
MDVHPIGVHLTDMYLTGVYLTGVYLMGVHLTRCTSYRAPNGATKRSFYLPITAVYGRRCRQIAGCNLAAVQATFPTYFNAPGAYRLATLVNSLGSP